MFSRVVCVIRSEIILGASILDFSVCYSSHASKCTIMIYVIVLYCSWLRVLTLTNLSTMHVNIQGMEGLWKNSGQKSWQKNTVLSTFFTLSQIKAIFRFISFLSSCVPSLKGSCSYFSNNFPTLKLFNMS